MRVIFLAFVLVSVLGDDPNSQVPGPVPQVIDPLVPVGNGDGPVPAVIGDGPTPVPETNRDGPIPAPVPQVIDPLVPVGNGDGPAPAVIGDGPTPVPEINRIVPGPVPEVHGDGPASNGDGPAGNGDGPAHAVTGDGPTPVPEINRDAPVNAVHGDGPQPVPGAALLGDLGDPQTPKGIAFANQPFVEEQRGNQLPVPDAVAGTAKSNGDVSSIVQSNGDSVAATAQEKIQQFNSTANRTTISAPLVTTDSSGNVVLQYNFLCTSSQVDSEFLQALCTVLIQTSAESTGTPSSAWTCAIKYQNTKKRQSNVAGTASVTYDGSGSSSVGAVVIASALSIFVLLLAF